MLGLSYPQQRQGLFKQSGLDGSDYIRSFEMLEHGLHCSLNLSVVAAVHGQLACLRYLLSVYPVRSSVLVLLAAQKDQLDCLKCIVEQTGGCEVTLQVWEAAMRPTCDAYADSDTDTDAGPDCDAFASNDTKNLAIETATATALPVRFRCLSYLLDTVPPQDGTFNLVNIACAAITASTGQLAYRGNYSLCG